MTIKEAARILHVHDNTLRRWSKRGMVRTYRVNSRGDRRFRREDIDQFLAEYNSKIKKLA
jgi:excisionase family DNA binding protein